MRITALAVAMLLALGTASSALGQAPASAKNLGITAQSLKQQSGSSLAQRRMATLATAVADQQFAEQQAVAFDPQASAASQANTVQQVVMLVPQQLPDGQQALFIVPQDHPGGEIQLLGHHAMAAGCPCNQQYGGPWAGGYGGPWAGGYGGPFGGYGYGGPYGSLHPGQPWSGGHYGPWGGAHRTPGYPHHHLHREYVGPQGPPTAQVAYPYYTVRGPRDFFIDNPPSIGR
jgi:hypothetical protein